MRIFICYVRFQHIDPDFPFNKLWKISDKLSRPQASLLMQLQTGHIPLNSYLHHIKKSDTRCCESCWGKGQLENTETVVHFLFECQTYAAEWYDMDRALGHHLRDLQGILASLDRVEELLKFIGRTARLKTMLGDAIGDVSHLETEEVWQVMLFIFQESMESMQTSKDKLVRPAGSPNPPLLLLPNSQPVDSKH